MKTTAKTLAKRTSAWQTSLPGFLPGVFIRKSLIFKGFRAVDALLGSKKAWQDKRITRVLGPSTGRSLWAVCPAKGPEYLLGPPAYFTDLKQHTSITAFPAGLSATGSWIQRVISFSTSGRTELSEARAAYDQSCTRFYSSIEGRFTHS